MAPNSDTTVTSIPAGQLRITLSEGGTLLIIAISYDQGGALSKEDSMVVHAKTGGWKAVALPVGPELEEVRLHVGAAGAEHCTGEPRRVGVGDAVGHAQRRTGVGEGAHVST